MKKPIIGITTNTSIIEGGIAAGSSKVSIGYDYITAVINAGGVPLLMPPLKDEACLQQQVMSVDGIILSGGGDVYPPLYGEEPSGPIGFVDLLRDEYELKLIELAVEMQKPLLGICRGAQVINIAFGGNLYQDLSYIKENYIQHVQSSLHNTVWHTVTITPNTILSGIMGSDEVKTNSSHHQVIKQAAPGFVVNARSKDGLIEGIEKIDGSFILGVQWHPERMIAQHPVMLEIFKAFIELSKLAMGRI